MGVRYEWQEQIAESGLQEVLGLAAALNSSGLFTEAELAPIRAQLKALVLVQAKGLIARVATPQPQPTMRPEHKEHMERVRQQLLKVGSAFK